MAYYTRENQIRAEAASKSIYTTIRLVEQRLNIKIPLVGTPSENRDLMIEIIRSRMR